MTLIIGSILGVSGGLVYRMRAHDGTLNRLVFWETSSLDSTGAEYTGPGPLTDIVVQEIKGQTVA